MTATFTTHRRAYGDRPAEYVVWAGTNWAGTVRRSTNSEGVWVATPDASWAKGTASIVLPEAEAVYDAFYGNSRQEAADAMVLDFERVNAVRRDATEAERLVEFAARADLKTIANMAEAIAKMRTGKTSGTYVAGRYEAVERLALMADSLQAAAGALKSKALALHAEHRAAANAAQDEAFKRLAASLAASE